MNRTTSPKYRRQRRPDGNDSAFVVLNGERTYLGVFNSRESRQAFHRVVAEWEAGGRQVKPPANTLYTAELCDTFFAWVKGYYKTPGGEPTKEVEKYRQAIRLVMALYADVKATEFGPKALRAVRQRMINNGASRGYINEQTVRVRRIFKWAVSQELLPAGVYQALTCVDGLRRGRSNAKETEPVRPVPDAYIDAVKPHVSRQVWALIQLQLLTGARPGELLRLRPVDLDTTGRVWLFTPAEHKTAHHGHKRTIYLGPKAQAVVKPFLTGRAIYAYLFSPIEAEAERRETLTRQRTTPIGYGNSPGTNRRRKPEVEPQNHYTSDTYRRAIERACDDAFELPADLARQRVQVGEKRTRWEAVADWKKRLGQR